MKNILYLFALILLGCKKNEDTPMKRIKYVTIGESKKCHIEYLDYPNHTWVYLDSVPGNYEFEYRVPVTEKLLPSAAIISIKDQAGSQQVQALIYRNDTLCSANNSSYPGYSSASNREAW